MILANTPSLGLIFGLPVALLVIAAGIYSAKRARRSMGEPYSEAPVFYWGGIVLAVGAFVLAAVLFWPFKWSYHSWTPVNGRVDKISSRFVSAGDSGGTNQRFVVVVNGQQYAVDDTRASLLKVGDTIHLKCKREFVWGSTDGWGCNWNGGAS